jgi:predicted aspartyl protease
MANDVLTSACARNRDAPDMLPGRRNSSMMKCVLHAVLRFGTVACAAMVLVWVAGCSGGSQSPRAQSPDGGATTVPLTLVGRHAFVDARVNGNPAKLLLDTGADQNVITPAAVARWNLVPSQEQLPGQGAGGEYGAVPWVRIDELGIGAVQQREQIGFVVPLPEELAADGVLGMPFFEAFVVSIDYEGRQLTLHGRGRFAAPAGVEPNAITLDGGKLVVQATAAGVSGAYAIDTGAGNALTMFTPIVEQYGLRNMFSPQIRTVTGVSPGGHTLGDLVRVPEVLIGAHRFTRVVTELSLAQSGYFSSSRYTGNLGAELWRRFKVTLDIAAGRMYLEPNAAYAEAFTPPRSGLVPAFQAGEIVIVDVVADSPAGESEIVAGDRILAVDGVPAPQLTAEAISAALRRPAGTQVAMRLRSAHGDERDVAFTLRDLL